MCPSFDGIYYGLVLYVHLPGQLCSQKLTNTFQNNFIFGQKEHGDIFAEGFEKQLGRVCA